MVWKGAGIDMKIRLAEKRDLDMIAGHDAHIRKEELEHLIHLRRVYVAEENDSFAGWLRYNLFWDNTPFMNLLYVLEPFRGRGYGRELVLHWERAMKEENYPAVMTSTASDEYAQHFYVKLNYKAVGGFTPKGEPYELIFAKEL